MTEPYYQDEWGTLYHGDCLEVIAGLPDASVDAVITDPPYGIGFMGKAWDANFIRTTIDRRRQYVGDPSPKAGENGGYRSAAAEAGRYDLSLTANQQFQRWCEAWGHECLRVLKPGGHLLASGSSRTAHRLTAGLEDAGFEIRDSIAWLYGSGFPKSLDVSKAIDKARPDRTDWERIGAWLRARRTERGIPQKDIAKHWPSISGGLTGCVANWEGGFNLPKWDQWLKLKDLLSLPDDMDAEVWRLNGRKGSPGEAWQTAGVTGTTTKARSAAGASALPTMGAKTEYRTWENKAANSDAARQWSGWGTALKPAFEPIVVARKPLAGTVAANVQAHGVGALNIDASRIEGTENTSRPQGKDIRGGNWSGDGGRSDLVTGGGTGRWPANVILDESQAAALDEQSGNVKGAVSNSAPATTRGFTRGAAGIDKRPGYADEGGASRFFYTAKADQAERITHNGIAHPTVKPLDLMRWLVRLVTPPGGTILEPFAGSGTTVEAAILEGFRCIAIEREADYLPLITQRIHRRRDPVKYLTAAGDDLGLFADDEDGAA